MGSFELSGADSLDEYVIEPLLGLRGLDIFLAHAAPETDIAEHPWLVQHGLRDVPTCIVNVMTQWGNILLYFEMPSWVESWDDIHEQESDSDAVKALKVRLFQSRTAWLYCSSCAHTSTDTVSFSGAAFHEWN